MLQQQSSASLQGADSIAKYYNRAETHVSHMLVSNIYSVIRACEAGQFLQAILTWHKTSDIEMLWRQDTVW